MKRGREVSQAPVEQNPDNKHNFVEERKGDREISQTAVGQDRKITLNVKATDTINSVKAKIQAVSFTLSSLQFSLTWVRICSGVC